MFDLRLLAAVLLFLSASIINGEYKDDPSVPGKHNRTMVTKTVWDWI